MVTETLDTVIEEERCRVAKPCSFDNVLTKEIVDDVCSGGCHQGYCLAEDILLSLGGHISEYACNGNGNCSNREALLNSSLKADRVVEYRCILHFNFLEGQVAGQSITRDLARLKWVAEGWSRKFREHYQSGKPFLQIYQEVGAEIGERRTDRFLDNIVYLAGVPA